MRQRFPDFPNFNPDYCVKVYRCAAVVCVAILVIEVGLLLIGGDRSALCVQSGYVRERAELPISAMIFMFSLPAGAVIIYHAVRWDKILERIMDKLETMKRQVHEHPVEMGLFFGFTPLTLRYFPFDALTTVVAAAFVAFCGMPLIPLLGGCL